MNKTIEWINNIIEDLVNPDIKLKDTFLKVQVLAFQIKHTKLKEWVDNELNGYVGKTIPPYRRIPTLVFGNMTQFRGFQGIFSRTNHPLPVEYLSEELRETLMFLDLSSSVSELELMITSEDDFQVSIPHMIHCEFSKILQNGWTVDSAWQQIGKNDIERIIGSIKSNLLNFLLELSLEIGENENIEIMEHKKKIDTLFDKTIGNLTGEVINISIGTDNLQTVNTGTNANISVIKGENVNQSITNETKQDLSKFIEELKSIIKDSTIEMDDKVDIENEIIRIETQLEREKPKYPIINEALNVIKSVLIGVTGNAFTPVILDKLSSFIG